MVLAVFGNTAHPVQGAAKLSQGFRLNLPDAFARQAECFSHFLQRMIHTISQTKTHAYDPGLARSQGGKRSVQHVTECEIIGEASIVCCRHRRV